jgi:hypothetical protein
MRAAPPLCALLDCIDWAFLFIHNTTSGLPNLTAGISSGHAKFDSKLLSTDG